MCVGVDGSTRSVRIGPSYIFQFKNTLKMEPNFKKNIFSKSFNLCLMEENLRFQLSKTCPLGSSPLRSGKGFKDH